MEGTTRKNTTWTVAEVETQHEVQHHLQVRHCCVLRSPQPALFMGRVDEYITDDNPPTLMTTCPLWRDTNSRWKRNTSETKPSRATLSRGEMSWCCWWKDGNILRCTRQNSASQSATEAMTPSCLRGYSSCSGFFDYVCCWVQWSLNNRSKLLIHRRNKE